MLTEEPNNPQSPYETEDIQHGPSYHGCGLYMKPGGTVDGVRGSESFLYHRLTQWRDLPSTAHLKTWSGEKVKKKRNGKTVLVQKPSIVYLPLVVDTEYQTLPNKDKYPDFYEFMVGKLQRINRGSLPLTVQFNTIRPTGHGIGTMVHPAFTASFPKARPQLPTPRNPLDGYLKMLFPGASLTELAEENDSTLRSLRKTRVLRIDCFAHFAVADLFKMWAPGPIHDHLIKLAVQEEPSVTQKRRTKIEKEIKLPNGQRITSRWERLPAIVKINSIPFALEIGLTDTAAMAGMAGLSLNGFHACAGVPLEAKDNYAKEQKELMLLQFIASCDPEGIENGAYNTLNKALPGKLDEALILCEAYGTGNLFRDYAEGDVTLYRAVDGFNNQIKDLYTSLGLGNHREPRPTVGSTVHDLLKAAVMKNFQSSFERSLDSKEKRHVIEVGFEPARAKGLAEKSTWGASNARVFGGRVLSTAPTLVSRKNASICDMDLAGAYASSMDIQIIPVGRPVIGQKFNRGSKRNEYEPLKKFLSKYENEFVPGCWQLVISCEKDGKYVDLPTDQDYFASWETPKLFEEDKFDDGLWLEKQDNVTVYTRQLFNSVLTHDGLQWLRHCASKELRTFIMENALVKASLFYPKSLRINKDDPKLFIEEALKAAEDGRKNTCEIKTGRKKATVTITEREFHGWIGLNVSELITGGLNKERGRWKKFTKEYDLLRKKGVTDVSQLDILSAEEKDYFDYLSESHEGGHPGGAEGLIEASLRGGKHPKDELAKLFANTIYGDLVSRFFVLSNPCVGNNITARVRSIIWFFEKSCRAWNSITDGGLFDLNEVNVARKDKRFKLNEKNTMFSPTDSNRTTNRLGVLAKPLGYDHEDPVIEWGWNDERVVLQRESGTYELEVSAAQEIVDGLTLTHVQNSFSHEIDVVNPTIVRIVGSDRRQPMFNFESKGIVRDAAIHGTANYYLRGGQHGAYKQGKQWTIKLRSYKPETHEPTLKPFFDQLIDNPEMVDRSKYWKPFTQGGILKIGKFSTSYLSSYQDTILEPGDTEYQIKIFREFTPSAFRFRTKEQREKFIKFHESKRDLGNHRKDSQGTAKGQSFESFFTDQDGLLDYRKMMMEIETAVREGRNSVHPELEIDIHPMRGEALDMKRSLWKDVIKDDRKYEVSSTSYQNNFEPFNEDDFELPEGY